MEKPKTLYDKIWEEHTVRNLEDGTTLLYIDRHIIHEVTSPQAFEGIDIANRKIRNPQTILATCDHNVPTIHRERGIEEEESRIQVEALDDNCKKHSLRYYGLSDLRQGVVHIVGPEQGFTLPGATLVCGDSHTATHGAFGSLAFGIGTSEIELVLATQTIIQKKSKTYRIWIDGKLADGVGSKDLILYIIAKIGTAGATGCVVEYAGPVIKALSMESRMAICNMTIEAGARAGLIAPDEITFEYLKGKTLSPKGKMWDDAVVYWKTLKTDSDAHFDSELKINASDIIPFVTWGTSPEMGLPITGVIPNPANEKDPVKKTSIERALDYMGLIPGTPLQEIEIDQVFIGSCTNGRIEDLREAAAIAKGRKVSSRVKRALVVPGSGLVKKQAEAEGLDKVFVEAGFEWRDPGCSMCLAMNTDRLSAGDRCASTSNRNFEGRQGRGGRTHLVSASMAAAAAIKGKLTDVRSIDRSVSYEKSFVCRG